MAARKRRGPSKPSWDQIHKARRAEIREYVKKGQLPKGPPSSWSDYEKRKVRELHQKVHGRQATREDGRELKGSLRVRRVERVDPRTGEITVSRKLGPGWTDPGLRDAAGPGSQRFRPRSKRQEQQARRNLGVEKAPRALKTFWLPSEHREKGTVTMREDLGAFQIDFPAGSQLVYYPDVEDRLQALEDPRQWAQDFVARVTSQWPGVEPWQLQFRVHTVGGTVGQRLGTDWARGEDGEVFADAFAELVETYSAQEGHHPAAWFAGVSATLIA